MADRDAPLDLEPLNLDQLRAFVDVAELGGFTAAADRRGLTQPAVSQKVRQLERRLGLRLIERVGRRATPTAAGVELLEHAARIEAAVASAMDAMARRADGDVGRVRLGAGATACIYLLPPILRDLRQRMPKLEITVTTGNAAEVVKAVEENRLDIGFLTLPASGRMLEVTPVMADPFVAVTARDSFPLPEEATAEALSGLPVLLFEPGGATRTLVDAWFVEAGWPLKPVMALGSVEAIKRLIEVGLGVSVLPSMALGDEAADGPLIARPLSPPLSRELAVVIRRDKPLSRGLRETLAALKALSRASLG